MPLAIDSSRLPAGTLPVEALPPYLFLLQVAFVSSHAEVSNEETPSKLISQVRRWPNGCARTTSKLRQSHYINARTAPKEQRSDELEFYSRRVIRTPFFTTFPFASRVMETPSS